MYKIAKYLTLEQRRAAANHRYVETRPGVLTCAEGRCPMGNALPQLEPRPLPRAVATALVGDHVGPTWWEIYRAAEKFIADFDGREIEDVGKALGVKVKVPLT